MQQIGKTPTTILRTSTLQTLDTSRRNFKPFINLRLLHHKTRPLISRHPRPGPLLQLPGPLTPRLSTRYPRPARYLQDSYQTRSSLSGPTMPSIRRSLDQLGHGPSACSTRISSAHKLPTGSGRVQSPDGLLRHPPPRKGQWLQSPSRTLNRRLPEFDLTLRGDPS